MTAREAAAVRVSLPPSALPSTDRLLGTPQARELERTHGRAPVADAARAVLAALRARALDGALDVEALAPPALDAALADAVRRRVAAHLRPVLNLSGVVLHTNLGRAGLAEAARQRLMLTAEGAVNLELELANGRRGERDDVIETQLGRLCGGEAATVVNNNAAALLLSVAALARRREVVVSRGELVEIGGSFRLPEILAAAGARVVEVGTTNCTHPHDYAAAIGARTAMLLKVHTSNYVVRGYTASVDVTTLAALAHSHGVPLVCDLGSGALVDLTAWGLPHEPLPAEALRAGCDLVTFSGDKLLGGPQAGLIVGTSACIGRLRRSPLRRALRPGRLTLAALEATLALYERPETLARELPTLRILTRSTAAIFAQAERLAPALAEALAPGYVVAVDAMESQIGSGAQPTQTLPSAGLTCAPTAPRARGRALEALAAALRGLPTPVIGRIADAGLHLDLRTLEDDTALLGQLPRLREALQ